MKSRNIRLKNKKSKHSSENMVNDTARLFIKENSNSA